MMNAPGQHIVQKVFLEVNTTSTEKATYLRQNLDMLFYREFFPWLEAYFNSLENKLQGKTVRLEKLSFSVDGDDVEIIETLKEKLVSQLEKEVENIGSQVILVNTKSPKTSESETLLHFLQYGTLPWFETSLNHVDILMLVNQTAFQQKLKVLLYKNPEAVTRLVYQLPKEAILVLLKSYASEVRKRNTHDASVSFLRSTPQKTIDAFKEILNLSYKIKNDSIASEENYQENILADEASHYAENAGLIMLAPYLPLFFRQCGLLDDENQLINKTLAVHLLHYLATNVEKPFEFELVFEKFLCGITLTKTLERNIEIPAKLKEETKNFMTELLMLWPQLKSTLPELFQNEFLQRRGKLTFKENSVYLIIERKAHDILLEQLPWNFKVLKLPWLNNIIYTDW